MLEGHEIYEAQSDRRAVRGKKHRLQKAGNLTETMITRQRSMLSAGKIAVTKAEGKMLHCARNVQKMSKHCQAVKHQRD